MTKWEIRELKNELADYLYAVCSDMVGSKKFCDSDLFDGEVTSEVGRTAIETAMFIKFVEGRGEKE